MPGNILDLGEPKEVLSIPFQPSWSCNVRVSFSFFLHIQFTHCLTAVGLIAPSELLLSVIPMLQNPGDNSLASSLSCTRQHFSSKPSPLFASFGFCCHIFHLFVYPTGHSISASFVISTSSGTSLSIYAFSQEVNSSISLHLNDIVTVMTSKFII